MFVGLIVKINSVLSTTTNRAWIGRDFTWTPNFLDSFFASVSSSAIITLMSTFLLFNFENVSLNIFCFFVNSNAEDVRWIVLDADSMIDFI